MKIEKKKTLRMFLAAEVVIFTLLYLIGPAGVYSSNILRRENDELLKEIYTIESEVNHLYTQIELVKTEPFYKEKIAREQLQMAKDGELIVYID